MGRIPINTAVQARSVVPMPMPSPSMGQAPIEAKRQQQAVIGKGIDMVGQMMENYAQSRKQIDVEADEATFKVFAKKRMANADFAARNATDPKEIDRIYSSAQNDIRQYIDGDTGGTPNIRWKDHQRDITNRFVQLSGDIEIATAEKKFELYDRDTKLKHQAILNDAISSGDSGSIDSAITVLSKSGMYSPEELNLLKTESEQKANGVAIENEKQSIEQQIFVNPQSVMDNITEQMNGVKTHYMLSPEDLNSMFNAANARKNKQVSANETAMWDRINAIKAGEGGDSFKSVINDLENLRVVGGLEPSAYNSLKKIAENPYGETKDAMSADELSVIWDDVSAYDPEQDVRYDNAKGLWSRINAISNERDRTLLTSMMKDAQDGEPMSPYWGEFQEIINAESRRNIFGDSEISTETAVFAKREIAKYLRENPQDRRGAETLYESITKDDKDLQTREFYRKKYGYGGQAKTRKVVKKRVDENGKVTAVMYEDGTVEEF